MNITCLRCHQRRPHEARGLCRLCYEKARVLKMLDAFPRGRRAPAAQPRTDYWKARYATRKAYQRKEGTP